MVKILDKEVGTTGYGLMGLTWRDPPAPRDQAFAAMKAALASDSTFWNGGEFYGTPDANSLHLLNAYFTENPGDAEKVVLSIKGAMDPETHSFDGSEAGIDKSIGNCVKVLGGKKKLDLFQAARVDPKTPIEETVRFIQKHVDAGDVGGISLSEVSAATIKRAAKVATIAAVEVEFSLFSTDILDNGIAEACAELEIPIVAYSPIGRGFLSGEYKKPEDIPKGNVMARFPRYQGEAFYNNLKLVEQVEAIAKKKGATSAQIAIAWVRAHSNRNGLGSIIPIPGASTDKRVTENCKDVQLSEEEMGEIQQILSKFETAGERYPEYGQALMNG